MSEARYYAACAADAPDWVDCSDLAKVGDHVVYNVLEHALYVAGWRYSTLHDAWANPRLLREAQAERGFGEP